MRLVWICSYGICRSVTGANMFGGQAFGLATGALTEVFAQESILEADYIFCFEKWHEEALKNKFPSISKKIMNLDIPDEYTTNDPALQGLIRDRMVNATNIFNKPKS